MLNHRSELLVVNWGDNRDEVPNAALIKQKHTGVKTGAKSSTQGNPQKSNDKTGKRLGQTANNHDMQKQPRDKTVKAKHTQKKLGKREILIKVHNGENKTEQRLNK